MDKYQKIPSAPEDAGSFPVSVLMRYQETKHNMWTNGHWEVSGLVVGEIGEKFTDKPAGHKLSKQAIRKHAIRNEEGNNQYLWSGLSVELFKDDAESYYHNIMSENPKAFIVCRNDETDSNEIQPFRVTLSYAEATSYMEVDDLVHSVEMPAELYRWVEQFVLEHYVPEKKRKRRRDNWKEMSNREAESETVK